MCEFDGGGDIGFDVADVATDISDSIDTDISSDTFDVEIDDISEDIGDELSEIDSSDLAYEMEDVPEDIGEINDLSDDEYYEICEIEEDVEISNDYEDVSETIEENGYEYTLDSDGRVSEVEGDLRLEIGERDLRVQREAGGEFRRNTDDGGHFIGNRFNGPGGDINIFAQDSNLNRGGYKSMENEWARELAKGNDVHVKIDPVYQEGTERPHAIMGEYTITEDGSSSKEYFSSTNENLRSEEFNIDDYDFEFPEEKNSI